MRLTIEQKAVKRLAELQIKEWRKEDRIWNRMIKTARKKGALIEDSLSLKEESVNGGFGMYRG